MKKYLIILYFICLGINIWADEMGSQSLVWITKPLLMPILLGIYLGFSNVKSRLLILALIFSWFGDIFLMITSIDLFIPGLLSFLIAHICYILLFKKDLDFKIALAIPFVFYSVFYFEYLQSKIDNSLKIPVFIYCVALTLMGILAAERNRKLSNYTLALLGALFFMASDSILAFNKFVSPVPYSSFLIMGTYGIAQYLITAAWLKQEN